MRRLVPVLVVALLSAACSDATTLLVIVRGDLDLGEDADGLDISMWRLGAQLWSEDYDVGSADLPLFYTLEPVSGINEAIELEVEATKAGAPVLGAKRLASFTEGTQEEVRICLWKSCIGSTPGWISAAGRCS